MVVYRRKTTGKSKKYDFFHTLFNIGLHKIVKRDKILFVRFNFMEYVEKWAPPTFLHIAEIAKNGATLA